MSQVMTGMDTTQIARTGPGSLCPPYGAKNAKRAEKVEVVVSLGAGVLALFHHDPLVAILAFISTAVGIVLLVRFPRTAEADPARSDR